LPIHHLTILLLTIFQHEYDHLEGILFLDRLASPADLYSEEEYQKISNIAEYKR
jgi:peptide deformylase